MDLRLVFDGSGLANYILSIHCEKKLFYSVVVTFVTVFVIFTL